MHDDHSIDWITPPVFFVSDDVCSFDSLDALLGYVEPWDVDASSGTFDALGRRVVLRAEGVARTRRTVGGGGTGIDQPASGGDASAELATALRDYLKRLGAERNDVAAEQLEGAPLSTLVSLAHRWSRCR
jgi:hypothetical protein